MDFNVKVDKRFEVITGIVVAYIKLNPQMKKEYDWIEVPENEYVTSLVNKTNLLNYPKLIEYIENIEDCAQYSKLFLYLDEEMEVTSDTYEEVFKKGKVEEFFYLVKELYDQEGLSEVFDQYEEEFKKIEHLTKDILPKNFSIKDIEQFYGYSQNGYNVTLSILANGGFGFEKENSLTYFKGVNFKNGEYRLNDIGFLICLFHEYSHPYINPLIDQYFSQFNEIDSLLEEAVENGLPNCYQKPKILLYEYLVRTNSIILASKYLSHDILKDDIEWFKRIGFKHIDSMIDLTINKKKNDQSYEYFFVSEVIPHFNSLTYDMSNDSKNFY